jgi:hypothetical protein
MFNETEMQLRAKKTKIDELVGWNVLALHEEVKVLQSHVLALAGIKLIDEDTSGKKHLALSPFASFQDDVNE